MNTELLLKVRDRILAEPEHFNMMVWVTCGTAACIAGHAVAIARSLDLRELADLEDDLEEDNTDLGEPASQLLQLTEGQHDRLFLKCAWPEVYFEQYRRAQTAQGQAQAAAERIDHFIATKGRE